MEIALQPVESSQIHAIGYDAATNSLAIQFKRGDAPGPVYHYANVPAATHTALLAAKSIGGYFKQFIKPHADKYPYTKQPDKKP